MPSTWQPTGGSGTSGGDSEIKCGTRRSTMATNALLQSPGLGDIKKCTFSSPAPGHVFGYMPAKDPEGAREVTMIWKEHKPSPATAKGQTNGQPLPDFKTLNKLAVGSGVHTAKEQPTFRATHMVTVKPTGGSPKPPPKLPSDSNAKHTYGMASAHRAAEVVRQCGPEEPPVKYLVQGVYQDEWVQANMVRDSTTPEGRPYIPPAPTKAVLGHSLGAAKYLRPHGDEELWKMSKFKTVNPRVTQYMTKGAAPFGGAAGSGGGATGAAEGAAH